MSGTGYVYCIEAVAVNFFKIGSTGDPVQRLKHIASHSPFEMRFRRVLDLGSLARSRSFENFALSWIDDFRHHGEWFSNIAPIYALMDEMAPSVDVTAQFQFDPIATNPRKSHPWSIDKLTERLAIADAMSDLRNSQEASQ